MTTRRSRRKQTLSEALRERLVSRGLTLEMAAQRIGVVPNTLRTWVARDRFPEAGWARIAELLDLPASANRLERDYDFEGWARSHGHSRLASSGHSPTLEEVFEKWESRLHRYARSYPGVDEAVCDFFGAMQAGDLFVFASLDVTPLEFEPGKAETLGRSAAEAILRGATLLYIRPSATVVERFNELWQMRKLPREEQVQGEFEDFRAELDWHARRQGQSPAGSVEQFCLDDDRAPFWTPGFTFALHVARSGRSSMSVRLPALDRSAILVLPCDNLCGWHFKRFVARVTDDMVKRGSEDQQRLGRLVHALLRGEASLPITSAPAEEMQEHASARRRSGGKRES